MKPKTKTDFEVVKLQKKIKPIGARAMAIAQKMFEPVAWNYTSNCCVCTECNTKFRITSNNDVNCPNCKKKLQIESYSKWKDEGIAPFAIYERLGNYQVVRIFLVHKYLDRFTKPKHYFNEAINLFINKKGTLKIMAKSFSSFSWNRGDPFTGYDQITLKRKIYPDYAQQNGYYFVPQAYYIKSLLPELARTGFDGDTKKCSPYDLLPRLLSNSIYETWWKQGAHNLIDIVNKPMIKDVFAAWKIANRHHYEIKSFGIWYDYLCDCKKLKMDLHNPKFICPENLNEAHRITSHRIYEIENRERIKRQRLAELKQFKAEEEKRKKLNDDYVKRLYKLLPYTLKSDNLNITALQSVEEFFEEGNAMNHCVYTRQYYTHNNCLILSAKDDNKQRLATIEIDTRDYTIKQIRAKHNGVPERYDEIKKLILDNKNYFNKLKYSRKKLKTA